MQPGRLIPQVAVVLMFCSVGLTERMGGAAESRPLIRAGATWEAALPEMAEGGTGAVGWTVDDVRFEWSEQHPGDQLGFTGGDCSLDDSPFPSCAGNTCASGSRKGLFCRTGRDDDCRLVAAEGVCIGGVCTSGLIGKSGCHDGNDCDLGICLGGNTNLGCSADSDCDLATNDCDAIRLRVAGPMGASFLSGPCATLGLERLFVYDCTSSVKVTVQDDTPALCGEADGCSIAPRQVLVNARSAEEPLGESFRLSETIPGSSTFTGYVRMSALVQQPGILFVASNPVENTNVIVSYRDPECDLNGDGALDQSDFADIDGDGVRNFGADGIAGDQSPMMTTVEGGRLSDDDDCFDRVTARDVYNPPGVPQIDVDHDGFLTARDCHVDPVHNRTGQCDRDDDGVGDICDNCPIVPNQDQIDLNGNGIGDACEDHDVDRDGVPDVADNCPSIYNPGQGEGGGGAHGVGSRNGRGKVCDDGRDLDGDGVPERTDNCPNERLQENGTGGFVPGPCTGGGTACTYNPDQRDTDGDGIGDACDDEDYDGDGVIDAVDNCPTIYNPADPALLAQSDSDGDGRGDDRKGMDSVGRCQAGNADAGRGCFPSGTAADCVAGTTGAFCAPSAEDDCDPRSADNDGDGAPDDLVEFTAQLDCNYGPGGLGAPALEIGQVVLSGVAITDDGSADPVCTSGDPDPGNDPVLPDPCPGRTNAECDTPGMPGSGACESVPDGFIDPGELASVRLTVSNQTVDAQMVPRPLTHVTLGLRSSSPTIGCVPRAQVFIGTIPTAGSVTTPAGALTFIASSTTGQSFPTQFAEATFVMTVAGDGIQGNQPDQQFRIILDQDVRFFPRIANACGGAKLGGGLGGGHRIDPGALCEDFDTDRNGDGAFEWTRLFPAADPNDPLRGIPDPNDDVLGHSVGGGPAPFGVNGQRCSTDVDICAGGLCGGTCYPVPTENDWHLHSPFEGCDSSYDPDPAFASGCAPEARAHSGFRSLHMGRHLSATDTLFDTYRMRQTSAFVMDPINLGTSTQLDFWHIISVCDDKCSNAGPGGTFAGGQVQISLRNPGTGLWERWQRLTPAQNGYNSLGQNVTVICEFDPGDDQNPPSNETICANQPQWSDMGDLYGGDRTCVTDEDGNDPVDKDCGSTTNRTALACSWIGDPNCGSFLENGSVGRGVWAREQFNLSAFAGREARLRWVDQMGGGWGYGESRSFLEPEPGFLPAQVNDLDDGWYIDDIRLTDLRVLPASVAPDPTDGLASCPARDDPDNCRFITLDVAGSAVDDRTGTIVLRAPSGALRTGVALDTRRSAAGPAGHECLSGVLQYQWREIDAGGHEARIISPFSSQGLAVVALDRDTVYEVEAMCTSHPGCTASATVQVQVYPGDGADLNGPALDAAGQPLDGLRIDVLDAVCDPAGTVPHHCLAPGDPKVTCGSNNDCQAAQLTWRARPQVPGIAGYDVFKRDVAIPGTDIFAGDRFMGGACLANAVAQQAAGKVVTLVDGLMPLVRHASLYMVAHSSGNTLAIAPLGYRPSPSTRPGTLVTAATTCP